MAIPSLFAAKAVAQPDGSRQMTVFATGGFTLELPPPFRLLASRLPATAAAETDRKGASAISLQADEFLGGTVVLRVGTAAAVQ